MKQPCVKMGRQRQKRLQRCTPQVLHRMAARNEEQLRWMAWLVSYTPIVPDVMQYGYCIIYGIDAYSWYQVCIATVCVFAKATNVHTHTVPQCYCLTLSAFFVISLGQRRGPYIGIFLALVCPLFMPGSSGAV